MRYHVQRLTLAAIVMLLAGSWLAASSQPQTQRSGSAQAELRAAMDKETVDGDLPAAIKLYQVIVEKYVKTDRATAATALVHLGECYQRVGDAQARAAFERILRDFGDVSEAAATARERLAALGAVDGSALSMRRVFSHPGLMSCGGMSSDARYVTLMNLPNAPLNVADVRTGEVRAVLANQGPTGSDAMALCAVFSPDNRQIAFSWMSKDSTETRIIGVNGTGLRTLVRSGYSEPLDWSPDGRQILAASERGNRTFALLSIQVDTGATRVVKTDGLWSAARGVVAAFSPDGRYVAYSAQASTESSKHDVFVMNSDGTGDAAVVQHPAHDTFAGWSPDGDAVLFLSDRTGVGGVWRIEVAAGRPRGAPVLVKDNAGVGEPVRMIGGTLYYGTRSSLSDVFLASLDPATGRGGGSRPAKAGLTGSDYDPDWSPDGRSLAYRSTGGGTTPAVVSILNVQTGEDRQLRLAMERLGGNDGPHWSSDGRSLLVIAMLNSPDSGVYRVDAQTGATTPIFKVPVGQYVIRAVWSHDGRSIFYPIGAAGAPTRYVRRDLASGAVVELVSVKIALGAAHLALSPDGQRLAFTAEPSADAQLASLNVVPATGGAVQPLYRSPTDDYVSMLTWSPDGRHVYFRNTPRGAANAAREYWRVGADGSGAEKTAIVGPERGFSISPDGRTIAFSKTESRTELWALENLAPKKPGR